MKVLRTPSPNAHLSKLERCGSAELLGIFDTCLTTGSKKSPYGPLAAVWGRLFSELFLSAEELIDEMQRGTDRFSNEHERMLQEFVKADCASGGSFVMNIIKTGGKIDRAALIMIADPEDLVGFEYNGKMALHHLIEICDKRVRPVLIRKAGKRLQIFDRRDIPLIFSIFGLCDLGVDDLDAIASVFSDEELKNIMGRKRNGRTAFEVFNTASTMIRRYNPRERNEIMERNAFYIPAAKDTKKEEDEKPARVKIVSRLPKKNHPQ
jgi:hypothetical protein